MSTAFEAALERCVNHGVTERPPVPGQRYVAFAVHSRQPGPIALAIAHRAGEQRILDLCRDGLTIAQSAELIKAYGVDKVTGAVSDNDGCDLAHAALGALNLLPGRLAYG
jgi:hypothetical protein